MSTSKDVDTGVLEILINCQIPPLFYPNFAGKATSELRRLSEDDLECWLRSCLHQSLNRLFLVGKIMSELKSLDEKDSPGSGSTGAGVEEEVVDYRKRNRHDADSGDEEQVQVEGEEVDDSDVDIVDEVINVSVVGVVDAETKAKRRIIADLTLEDDEITPDTPPTKPLVRRDRPCPASKKRKTEIEGHPTPRSSPSCSSHTPAIIKKKCVFQLGRVSNIRNLDVEWTMGELQGLISPSNFPLVEQLSILSNCDVDNTSCNKLSLPNLVNLKIRHCVIEGDLTSHDINYSSQLCRLLAGSPSLDRIEISFEDELALKTLLGVLGSVKRLPSLSSLSIRHQEEQEMVALLPSELNALGRITAPKLKELHLACCIWAAGDGSEIKTAFGNMLQRFQNLRKLKIDGCFVTTPSATDIWPTIVLDFPRLIHLQVLDLGESCKYMSSLETLEELPKRKSRKKLPAHLDPEQRPDGLIRPAPARHRLHLAEDESGEYFPVSINLNGIMSRLEIIRLGVLYEFETLFFTELPVLKIFRVASAWAQSYPKYFPRPTGKKSIREGLSKKSKAEELQFPDLFKDYSEIGNILSHFPNLTHVYINLPSVKLMRAFAKTMVTSGPITFQHLEIRTQFDFASSLDSCVLDEIVQPSASENEQIKILKAYPYWEEYVRENEIEVPQQNGEVVLEEDSEKFCGLGILFRKLKSVSLRHIPRTLRLPKGPKHFIKDPQPEFGNTLIGFTEYPFSKAVKAKCPATMTIICYDFDMSQVSGDFNVTPYRESRPVTLDPTAPAVKHEVKREAT